ncbi:hypothetical protein Tco_1282694 [Tanacetum coccineum]
MEDQPLPADASPVALSLGYVANSDLEEDPEEDHADYPADGGDDDDEPSDDDTDDEDEEPFEDEDDYEEEECISSGRLFVVPVVDPVPSVGDTEAFGWMSDGNACRCLAAPALPSSPLPIVPHPYGSPNYVRAPPSFRATMGRLRALSPSTTSITTITTSTIITTFTTTVDHREDIPEAELPPRKRLCSTAPTLRYKVGESLTASPRPTGGHKVDYGFIGTLDAKTRRQRAEAVSYEIRDTWVDPRERLLRRTEFGSPLQASGTQDSHLDPGSSYRCLGVTARGIDCTGFITAGAAVSGSRTDPCTSGKSWDACR